jgi:hypothetical protein
MIIKIDDYKIKHQLNIKMFIWDHDNFIESKLNQVNWRKKLIKR